MNQAVIFDLDDTLYAERDYAMSGFEAVAAAFAETVGAPAIELIHDMRALFDTNQRGRVFDAIVAQAAVRQPLPRSPEALVAEMIETYRAHRPRIAMFPDADRALARLAGTARLGVISDGLVSVQQTKIDALRLRPRVNEVIITGAWGRKFWKPHVRAFEEMAARLALPHAACTYVADNPAKDFIAPRALGWRTVMVHRPSGIYADQRPIEGAAADVTITDLDSLVVTHNRPGS